MDISLVNISVFLLSLGCRIKVFSSSAQCVNPTVTVCLSLSRMQFSVCSLKQQEEGG